jgi:FeS assembly protein IscX
VIIPACDYLRKYIFVFVGVDLPGKGGIISAMLTWDDSYAIALALRAQYPHIELEQVSLGMIYRWTRALPDFEDDPELANEAVLTAIYQEWYEEATPL